MGWTPSQRQRLGTEKVLLETFFAGRVTWIDPTGDTKVEVELNTNNGKKYRLRVYLRNADSDSSDFPNSVPDMVVSASPKPMPRWGGSAVNHTIGYRDDFLKICHYHPSKWTDRSTLYEVVMKGRVWLEAYEGHLTTAYAKYKHDSKKSKKKTCNVAMGWTAAQRQRLGTEKVLLEKYFAGRVTWIDPTGDTKVEVELNTNNDKKYRLRIYLRDENSDSSDFPNSVPDMVVLSSPKRMPRWGVDGENHTIGYRDGFLKICHYHPSKWTDRSTLYEVVMKGRIWLEAYEGYLTTKKNLSFFLGEM